jgi:hypothetical protein
MENYPFLKKALEGLRASHLKQKFKRINNLWTMLNEIVQKFTRLKILINEKGEAGTMLIMKAY